MLKIVRMEFTQLVRKPLWFSIFALVIVASIFLPRANMTDLTVVPGMVYFVMIMTLILSLYGAEQARTEIKQQIDETFSVTPVYKKYVIGEIIYWLLLAFSIYIVFYLAVVGYIGIAHKNITIESIYQSLIYTLLCWFIPFFYSLIIGYVIYRWFPNILSYLIIIIVWFLTMPYNSMIGFLPREWGGWMINGDPNIIEVFSFYPLESLEINNGYYLQRIFMFLILISVYLLTKYKRILKIRVISIGLLAFSMLIPIFSPYVPYIIGSDSLEAATLPLSDDKIASNSDYQITKYIFHLKHGASNHKLKYKVDIEIKSEKDRISFVLLNDFQINSIKMNQNPVTIKRSDHVVQLELPESSGVLEMEIETNTYNAVGPSTIQLLATSAWYPMSPSEAKDPYGNGVKEDYEIYWESATPNSIGTNLDEKSTNYWVGKAYGPTILMGDLVKIGNVTFPEYTSLQRVKQINQGLNEIFQENNKKYNTDEKLPENIYFVTTFYGMQANPDEAYIYPDIYPTEDILRVFYRGKGD